MWREMILMCHMAWEKSRGLLLAFMMHFSQNRLKTGHYRSSCTMSFFLQEHAKSVRSDLDSGVELREGE